MGVIETGGRGVNTAPRQIVTDIELTSAELLALHTAASVVEVLPAPGEGYAHVIDNVVAFLDFNETAYGSVGGGDDIRLRYTNNAGATLSTIETTGLLNAAADATRYSLGSGAAVVWNARVVAALSGQVTSGDSPLHLRIFHKLLKQEGL